MVAGLAFVATAVATLFAEATFKRWRQGRRPHEAAWTVALALFALASAALATGASTGWDRGVFRVFYLLGAVLNVPWLALGTVYLLFGERAGRRVRAVLLFASGLAVGVMLTAPVARDVAGSATIPVGKEVFGVFPRVLAAVGSGLGALVVFGGAAWSAVRFARAARSRGAAPRVNGPSAPWSSPAAAPSRGSSATTRPSPSHWPRASPWSTAASWSQPGPPPPRPRLRRGRPPAVRRPHRSVRRPDPRLEQIYPLLTLKPRKPSPDTSS